MSAVRPRRNSLRYPGYDYSQPGAVFVTINTHEDRHLFGDVYQSIMHLSPQGVLVHATWIGLQEKFPDILLDGFVVMPNHVHGIIMTGSDPLMEHTRNTVGLVVNSFKNTVIAAWRKGVREDDWARYQGKLWHRDYCDRIIRNDVELNAIREYIRSNPARWSEKRGG